MKRVLLLGASRYYTRQIRAVQAMGCEAVVVDREPSSPGFELADHHAVVDITDIPGVRRVGTQYAVQAVVPLNDFGVRTASAVSQALGLAGLPDDVARRATDKSLMKARWREAGVPTAPFALARTYEEAVEAARQLKTWPLILKPSDSRGGASRGVSVVEREDQLAQGFTFAQSFYRDPAVLIEAYVRGLEHSAEVLVVDGEATVIAISDKVKTPPPYRVDRSVVYPTTLSPAAAARAVDVVVAGVRAIGIEQGPAHVEFCTTGDGVFLFELGARCGGGGTAEPIVPFVTGIALFQEAVRLALGERPPSLVPTRKFGCIYRFLTPPPGRVKAVHGVERVRARHGILDCDVLVGPGGDIRPVRTGLDRAGFVIAGAETREQAWALADEAEGEIRFEYVDGDD